MRKKTDDSGPRQRIVRLLLAIAEQPRRFTKKELAERFGYSRDTITDDFRYIIDAGFKLEYDKDYRYYFVANRPYQQFQDLLHFSTEDQALLGKAIELLPLPQKRQEALKAKLAALYDFRRLGHAHLREPYLTKMDLLETAKAAKKQVVLEEYRSSQSNTVRDRTVEPFLISPAEDTVQTFDVEKQKVNHFRITRIGKVQILETPWQYEARHYSRLIDPFRIVNNDQVMVRLRLRVGAYNELTERFPATKGYIEETHETGVYDFQCKVNRNFIGLSNFILGFYHQGIEIVEPEALREHLREVVRGIEF